MMIDRFHKVSARTSKREFMLRIGNARHEDRHGHGWDQADGQPSSYQIHFAIHATTSPTPSVTQGDIRRMRSILNEWLLTPHSTLEPQTTSPGAFYFMFSFADQRATSAHRTSLLRRIYPFNAQTLMAWKNGRGRCPSNSVVSNFLFFWFYGNEASF
ncbi:hypothetical protein BD779DRAFT_1515300 [Infundibulicybe gibba]|nr:hypothetical protein BD779DRAFT_1515300 [Infundibulicybe gibba]